mmetsp:Transcript_7120/g.31321  ORF Transcript_7120/g.31321 Transcript_7120/m.31321 type:complete len:223 (-) Transcript_7120:50-718(-)
MATSFSSAASRSTSMDRSRARSRARVSICDASSSRRKSASTTAAADLVLGWGPTARRQSSGTSRLRRTTIARSPSPRCSTPQHADRFARRRSRKRSPMRLRSPRPDDAPPRCPVSRRAKSRARASSSTRRYRSPAAGDRSVAQRPRMSTTTLPTRPPAPAAAPRTSAYSGSFSPRSFEVPSHAPSSSGCRPGTTVRFRGASAEQSTSTSPSRTSLTYRPGGR